MAEADLDKLMGHLTGASFQNTFFTWCSEHCAEFSGYEPGCEHRHAWRSLHSDFSELFDKLMDEFLQEVGWEKGYVMELCSGAEGGGAEFVTTLVESMEYESFCEMMKRVHQMTSAKGAAKKGPEDFQKVAPVDEE